jgi:hypothetical protein
MMKKKVLIIVHLEPDFKPPRHLVGEVVRYSNLFRETIVVESASGLTGTEPFEELDRLYYNRTETWVWGWPEPDCYSSEEDFYESEGHDFILFDNYEFPDELEKYRHYHKGIEFPYWMKDLPDDRTYYLVGGGIDECLLSFAKGLHYLGHDVRIVESLTY